MEKGQRRDVCYDEAFPVKFLEKKLKRYVIVSPDNGLYLDKYSFGVNPMYRFTTDITKATKTTNLSDAKMIIHYYYKDTGDYADLIAIPLEISYELVNDVGN